eukprot:gene17157-biopygen20344
MWGDSRGDNRVLTGVGRQQGDDEPHLAKERHGHSTTQSTVQRLCPIIRLQFPLCGANGVHRNQTPPHAIKTPRATRPVQRRQAGESLAFGSDSPHTTLCGARKHLGNGATGTWAQVQQTDVYRWGRETMTWVALTCERQLQGRNSLANAPSPTAHIPLSFGVGGTLGAESRAFTGQCTHGAAEDAR